MSIEALNQSCHCLSVDLGLLRTGLGEELQSRSLSDDMITTHPHLFSSVPLFVSRSHLDRMAQVISAIDAVVASAHFQAMVLAWAPDIARFDPKSSGGMLGYDFHLSVEGPKLIEINTNPGGALLNALLGKAQRSCCQDAAGRSLSPSTPPDIEREVMQVFKSEWQSQRGGDLLQSIAIVDETPQQQYLYPEFRLYEQLFRKHDIEAHICAPKDLQHQRGRLWARGRPIDFLYNRLTDFALERPAHAMIKAAYLQSQVVLSPHPRAHALYADKRNFSLLGNAGFLSALGLPETLKDSLLAAIPATRVVTEENRDSLWEQRRVLFFKPAGGFGSKAAYRGDKITKRVWEQMRGGVYVAQAIIPPSERRLADPPSVALKADVRCYAYAGQLQSVAARLYQGQTTNFRTPGGGFAPVFTEHPPLTASAMAQPALPSGVSASHKGTLSC
jgi:hypothetical protein